MANNDAKYQAMYEAEQNAKYQAMYEAEQASNKPSHNGLENIGMGALKGASDIGATLLKPVDYALNKTGISDMTNDERRASLKSFFNENADTDSLSFKGGELAAGIAGTAGVGGALAKPIGMVAPKLAASVASGGFSLGGSGGNAMANALTRGLGGAINGGVSAGMINPESAGIGASLGAAIPMAGGAVGLSAKKLGQALSSNISPEVKQLANRAGELGIDIPLDRLKDSKVLNAISSGLNYVPLSGRAATEAKMNSQLNRALSRTFGQDSDNVTMALRKASDELGGKFDDVLKNNTVKVDDQLLSELADIEQTAARELGSEALHPIKGQLDEILAKGQSGAIDGQAAYNIKRTLDRIGKGNNPNAYHARELKKSIMSALDRSIGADEAAAFANTRKQYGNMLSLENLAKNGVDGEVSAARLANLKNINNKELQEMADIAAQFVKPREGQHGSAQRALAGILASSVGGAPALAGSVTAGRLSNALLNSKTLKNAALGNANNSKLADLLRNPDVMKALTQTGVVATSQ